MEQLVAFSEAYPLLWCSALLVLGLFIGSFLNVVIHRLPVMLEMQWPDEAALNVEGDVQLAQTRYDLWWPRSHCPNCHQPIVLRYNVPVLGWLVLRGRSHCCNQTIAWRYPLVEAATGILFVAAGSLWPPGVSLLGALALLAFLIALAAIDAETLLLPDALTQPLLWLGLFINLSDAFVPLESAVIGAMAGYLALWVVYWLFKTLTGKDALGAGDFKLLAALGAWLGWQALPQLVLLAALGGLVMTCLWRWRHGGDFDQPLAFGPWLAISGGILLFVPGFSF
ncbi:prepilin peptidase [Candidatus Symbiopectobacterium sp. 'North America']|uniref:prepilin peptidase n=1 Tax=Candidatus Symbiopectobacterium sp. 'North America' TaxID=2794574 RepID=UPI0018CA8F14|nr:A24 family peptidase [Candidatus Symbiopectobacterium sp. 'North America']MBG6243813.1 prepilin peptidase [Candidatus Symbiopectobacterium sp. 'North America']